MKRSQMNALIRDSIGFLEECRFALPPGQSICLVPGLYHEFWPEGGTVLIGEVSAVNDDTTDNRFTEEVGRFPEIEEDEPPLYYLCNEYPPAD